MGDIFDALGGLYGSAKSVVTRTSDGNPSGFTDLASIPSSSGNLTRQAKIANERNAIATRNVVKWFLPEKGIVEMYINPKNISYTYQKDVGAPKRTRGGYILQYWGEKFLQLSISGTTGSSGIEGINVLEEIYRNEQVALDAIALAASAAEEQNTGDSLLEEIGDLVGLGSDSLLDQTRNLIETGTINPDVQRPTLASLAFQVEMYWSGWVFRGYFTNFSIEESADNLGMFNYKMEFMVTQKRGYRLNFMPWHRSAVNGQSNSDPAFGTPYSFGTLRNTTSRTSSTANDIVSIKQTVTSIDQALKSYRTL